MANGNGHEFGHSHSPEDIESEQMLLDESHPIWASERIVLTSAGIDIGSTTSHLLFSQLVLRRQGISLSSRFQIVNKKLLYESPILITPFLDGNVIDTAKLSDFIARAYKESGIKPEEVNTGAVIITGETARKDNAEAIANMFSAQAGKFVCA
ncbi:MAG: ethanolamine ammonia-lyase reactivating factor EutA, partial [Dehalococcoidia bacterium]|nr:ethanolamine ammonia-lyase reactivating factor EutA [Dehalococcoidia bacterium]